uniref:Uncharacterized protein n=1 Tax=Sphingobacterium sp. (strain 21) TaxID=743722 RepID=F4CF65_SPHS2
MKTHTTNYINTFIEVADDCTAKKGEIPPEKKSGKTIANMQFDLIMKHPYQYTSDDILFQCFVWKNDLKGDLTAARADFFSKGQACLRSSPLAKRYGWGIHSNEEGKVALYGVDSDDYAYFCKDKQLKIVKAMRSKRV